MPPPGFSAVLRRLLRGCCCDESARSLFALVSFDVPVTDQSLDQFDQERRFAQINVNDQIDILLHVSTDVAQSSQGVDRLPRLLINLAFESLDLVDEPILLDLPEVSDHPL